MTNILSDKAPIEESLFHLVFLAFLFFIAFPSSGSESHHLLPEPDVLPQNATARHEELGLPRSYQHLLPYVGDAGVQLALHYAPHSKRRHFTV